MQLLVSVRSVEEAIAAMEGGAALIDIKEPSRGSLGRADASVIRDIAAVVGTRLPVSAALGEWADEPRSLPDADVSYVKWGLAGCRHSPDWRPQFNRLLIQQRPQFVLVAYADWQCANAPSVEDVFTLACEHAGSIMLIDTHCKDSATGTDQRRPTLLDWLPAAWIEDLCERARQAQVKIALAGSLGIPEIHTLLTARPTWFAVRGAVCDQGNRQAGIQMEKVRQLVELIHAG